MNNHPIRKEKIPPKVRKLDALTMEVWDIMLMIVLVLKILKSLSRQHGVTQILKKVLPQPLKMQGMIPMIC